MTAGVACAACGVELRDGARFCDACGAAIASQKSAEYKQVTVLFADVVRSMDMAAALGAERLREVMAELVDRSAGVVQRYGGTVDKFTGDGIMAVFGAPVALEDHATRGCLAALDIQNEAQALAVELERRDGVALRLRVGLNSGEVIAGEVGSAPLGYTAVGEQVGMAQRMESVAPPGGVMLSESTARLVQNTAVIVEPELHHIKGVDDPVSVHRLLGVTTHGGPTSRQESTLIGRRWELGTIAGALDAAVDGQGCVVGIAGPPGIGKSRLVRESTRLAADRGIPVFAAACESHTSEVPFRAVATLLRAVTGITDLDGAVARERLRAEVSDADPQDLLLLEDLLGVGDAAVPRPAIDPDARRRRLTAMLNAASLARPTPAVYVIEDVHWIDKVSESMVADLIAVIPQTHSLVLVTYRPEYRGVLSHPPGAHTISVAPLNHSDSVALIAELLGTDPSVTAVVKHIRDRAAGNPFYVEEIVRELATRGVLSGDSGAFVCDADVTDVSVPATLQATIAARIDHLEPGAKRALGAASVIGSRFTPDLLTALGIEPVLDALVQAELVDQVRFTPHAEYAFRHPLIRAVAYESQLKSDRAELHRRLAAAIEGRDPASADENAALIAEHLESAGELHAAYSWHMRAGTWATNRDIAAAWMSWERASRVADSLPGEDAERTTLRIAPRTLLCGSAWRVHAIVAGARFDELRELCDAVGDKASLAIGMTGLLTEHVLHARLREASRLAAEHMALTQSLGDAALTVGLSFAALVAKHEAAEMADLLRWSQTIVDLAGDDPGKGNLIIGSPLAAALSWRGVARWSLGRQGWREDLDRALAMAREADPMSQALVVNFKYSLAIAHGVLLADDTAMRETDEAVQIAEKSSDDLALSLAQVARGFTLAHRGSVDREKAVEVLSGVRETAMRDQFSLTVVAPADFYIARVRALGGDRDGAIPLMRAALRRSFENGQLGWCIAITGGFVETLVERGSEHDVAEAEAAVDRLADAPADEGLGARDIMLLRMRALLSRARGDEVEYRELVGQYRVMAESLGFEGHMKWAEAMT